MRSGVLSPEQLQLGAEEAWVGVVPLAPLGRLELMGGGVGPLEPQVPASLPLWLALHLARRNRCRLRVPAWLTRSRLEQVLARERELGGEAFGALPSPHFVELATLYLEHARDTVAEGERVRQLVEQIVDARKAKVMEGLSALTGPTVLIKLNNLTRSEINVLRPFILKAMAQFDELGLENVQ